MKIAMVSVGASPLTAHSDPRGLHIAELAAALARQRHSVTVYTSAHDGFPGRTTRDGYAVVHLPQDLGEFADGLVEHWQDRPHVVHARSWESGVVSGLSARRAGVPFVLAPHGDGENEPPSARRALCNAADRIIVTSARRAAELVSAGARKARVRVVPPGVNADVFQPDGPRASRARPHRVLWVGESPSGYGVERLKAVRDTEFVQENESTRRLATAERAAFIRSADVVVCAGSTAEHERTVLEAMACGVPAVVIVPGGPTDVVVHGVTGVHVSRDAHVELVRTLRALLADPSQLDLLGTSARDRACVRYSWDRIATDTAYVYEQAISAHGGLLDRVAQE
ncbi:glycosyltransferase [Lentzea alba]|uniref:glycosyltransferase n=1 Tax=Lentzea alba TaxID=2714351 RepID=UPI0039BF6E37